jgi:hypothetical protein
MLSRPRELVALGLRDVAEVLVGNSQRADLGLLPDCLPTACTMGGLECRLDHTMQVDFGLCLQQSKSFAGMGFPWDCEHRLPQNLAAFVQEWVSHDSLIRDSVDYVWLGFDRTGSREADTPFVYFSPSFGSVSFASRNDEALLQVISEGLELLAPGVHANSLPAIQCCLAALPERGEVLLAASLHSRGRSCVRLELRVQTSQLIGFLQRCGWPGDYGWLEDTLVALDAHQWHMPLQIEMTNQILPSLSLEFSVPSCDLAGGEWRSVLDQFVDLGYCLPEKRAAVVDWVESRSEAQDRQLDLKIKNNGHGEIVAKAYLVVEDTLSLF